MRAALKGLTPQLVLGDPTGQYQVALVPVMANGQVVGVLLLGETIGAELARDLKSQMRCEVTFLTGNTVTGSSLQSPGDRGALMLALRGWRKSPAADLTVVEHVEGRAHEHEPHAAEQRVEMGGERQPRQPHRHALGQHRGRPQAGHHADGEQPGPRGSQAAAKGIDVH